uniref:Angiotensin-converting enzyme n=1 Tax=Glossina austeni TaxID=7395 RepID=A0A1A9V9W6_GLOAU
MTTSTLLIIVLCMLCLAISQAAKSTPAPTSRAATATDKYAHAGIYETHAREALLVAAKRMQHIYNRKRDIFHSLTQGRGYSLMQQGPIKQEIDNDYHSLVHELALNLSVIPVQQLKNATLRRQVQRLSKLQLYGLDKADLEQAKEMLHTMQSFQTSRLICVDDCTQMVAMIPTIKTQVIRTKNLKDLEYYWLKWRQVIGENDLAKSSFIDFVRYLRIAATYNGHVTPSRTWYLYYDSENFQRELEDIVWEMMPLYKELHAYLRYSIRLTYGQQLTESDGGIPAPVFEQIISQSWYPRPVFRTPYPKSQLPTVKQRLEEVMVTPVKINKKVAEFFESLGLNHMSDAFYEKFSRRINDDEIGPNCEAEVFYFPPDVALRYCPKLDYKILLQMHGHMAELQYNLYKKELPFGLDREPCPGFGSAIGEAAIVSSGTPRHLHRLHILLNSTLSIEHSMNRLFRMCYTESTESVQKCRWLFVLPALWCDPSRNLPPYEHELLLIDLPSPMDYKFISEVLGFEFYRAFCLASGEYKPGNPDFPLSNCDFYGSKRAGNMIKKMMQQGATKHWRDVMEIATSERKLSAKGLMEYFGPLFIWLKEENKRLDIQTGWDDDIGIVNITLK